ncbi:unnamed protein product, partial [Symbiodinium sp. KB8]
EMERGGHFVADVWKRFVVDEKIDCCVKYGFTSKRRFGTALKVQELENITVREESRDRRKSCEQLRRKVVCDIKATFTTRDEEVEPDAGILRYIPHDDLGLVHSVLPDNSIQECMDMINDLSSVHVDVESRHTAGCGMLFEGQEDQDVILLDHASVAIFKQVESTSLHKLMVRWPKLHFTMEKHGGTDVF